MTRLHFHPIEGKKLDIIDAILQTEEMATVGDALNMLNVVIEEIVVNIVNYSTSDYVDVEIIRDEERITLRFHDGGVPFNPLKKDPPDFSIPFENRQIGGLGIFLVIENMDVVEYEYTGGENILTVMRKLETPITMSYSQEEFEKLKAEKERMDAELRLASQIQLSMLPTGHMAQDGVDIFASLVPAREMGGDLVDYSIRDGKLYFCIGDVCGKGAPAAMIMAYAHALLMGLTQHESNPARIIHSLNKVASRNNESCTFFTLFAGVLDLQTGRLQYCNAAHNPPYILGNELWMLDCDANQPIGPLEDAEFSLQETTLIPGCTIFLYTDGLTEANNTEGEELGTERMEEVLRDCIKRQLKPEEMVNAVTEAVHQFTVNAEQSDDMTLFAICYAPQN